MTGRENEPIAAFFPSIDRNLLRDLDRQLRMSPPRPALSQQAPEEPAPVLESASPIATTSDILVAVDQAAASMTAMQARIHELEAKQYDLEATNTQLKAKLAELLQNQQAIETMSRADRQRAAHAEQIATQHEARAQGLEKNLETALGDLQRIAAAITSSLVSPGGRYDR